MNLGLDKLQAPLEKLTKLPKPYRMAMAPAVAILVAVLYVYAMYLPARAEMNRVNAQTLEVQRKLNEARSIAANLEKFKQEIEKLDKEVVVALRQLPNGRELPVLLTDVTSLGKSVGLEFESFKPQDEVPRDFYAEVPIDIQFKGSYHDIARFFDEIAKLPRIVNVNQIEMTVATETMTDTTLAVKGSATTFRFLDKPAAPEEPQKPGARGGKAPAARRGGQA